MLDMRLIDLPSGGRIWYKETGSGHSLLQIHGSAFGHRNFEKMTPLMAPHCKVIDFDLPGYGESQGVPQSTLEGIAGQVYEFIQAADHDRVSIHGTSFGAMLALTLAAAHPEVVDKLVLSCFLAKYDNAARMMRATWKRTARDSGMEAVADLTSVAGFARGFYDRPDAPAQLAQMRVAFTKNRAEAFIAGTEAIERSDLSALVSQVTAPTLLLAGAEDHMTPFQPSTSGSGLANIQSHFQNARLSVLPVCGHYLVIEQPQLAANRIIEFLSSD
jgi:3-oxoadipate enol-lactonase